MSCKSNLERKSRSPSLLKLVGFNSKLLYIYYRIVPFVNNLNKKRIFLSYFFFNFTSKNEFASTFEATAYNNVCHCVAHYASTLHVTYLCNCVKHIDEQKLLNKHMKTRFILNAFTNEENNNTEYNGEYTMK